MQVSQIHVLIEAIVNNYRYMRIVETYSAISFTRGH